ncbi:MAG: hypothetical protein RL591_1528, partial [Planctomycetota bacterium]
GRTSAAWFSLLRSLRKCGPSSAGGTSRNPTRSRNRPVRPSSACSGLRNRTSRTGSHSVERRGPSRDSAGGPRRQQPRHCNLACGLARNLTTAPSPAPPSLPPKSPKTPRTDRVCGAPRSLTVAAHWISVPSPDFRLAVTGVVGVRFRGVPCGRRGIGGLGSWGCLKRFISFDDALNHGLYDHGLCRFVVLSPPHNAPGQILG